MADDRVSCPNGHENAARFAFCTQCGAQLNASAAGSTAVAAEIQSNRRALLLLGVGGAVAAAAIGLVFVLSQGQTLRGTFSLYSLDGSSGSWNNCSGTGGYDDFGPGMNVTVRDGGGSIIATSTTQSLNEELVPTLLDMEESGLVLGAGASGEGDEVRQAQDDLEDLEGFACIVYFEAKIPDSDFYAVEVGRRGSLSYSREELADADYVIALSLSDSD